jgi:hypothetical protein
MVTVVGDINTSLLSDASRAQFNANEKTVIALFEDGFIGRDETIFQTGIADGYVQHALGVAQGRDGVLATISSWSVNRLASRHVEDTE